MERTADLKLQTEGIRYQTIRRTLCWKDNFLKDIKQSFELRKPIHSAIALK